MCIRDRARHDTENPNSGKVMAAAGMYYEGTLRHAGFTNPGICDEAVYAKVRSAAVSYTHLDVYKRQVLSLSPVQLRYLHI